MLLLLAFKFCFFFLELVMAALFVLHLSLVFLVLVLLTPALDPRVWTGEGGARPPPPPRAPRCSHEVFLLSSPGLLRLPMR